MCLTLQDKLKAGALYPSYKLFLSKDVCPVGKAIMIEKRKSYVHQYKGIQILLFLFCFLNAWPKLCMKGGGSGVGGG